MWQMRIELAVEAHNGAAQKRWLRKNKQRSKVPNAASGGALEQIELRIVGSITSVAVCLDVAADHIGGHFVTHRPGKIIVFPKFAAPELPLDLRELTENSAGREAFQPRHRSFIPHRKRWGILSGIW